MRRRRRKKKTNGGGSYFVCLFLFFFPPWSFSHDAVVYAHAGHLFSPFFLLSLDAFLALCIITFIRWPSGVTAGNKQLAQRRIITIT